VGGRGERHMLITDGSISDVITWFNAYSNARLLGLFVAGDSTFNKFLKDVLVKSASIDIVSGSQIDLVLFNGNNEIEPIYIKRAGAEEIKLKATPLTKLDERPTKLPSGLLYHISNIKRSAVDLNNIIKNTTTASHDVIGELDLSVDDIPCLVIIGKWERQKVTVSIKNQTDADFVIELIRAIRAFLDAERSMGIKDIFIEEVSNATHAVEKNTQRLARIENAIISELVKMGTLVSPFDIELQKHQGQDAAIDIIRNGLRQKTQEDDILLSTPELLALAKKADNAMLGRRIAAKKLVSLSASLPSAERLGAYVQEQEECFAQIQTLVNTYEAKLNVRIGLQKAMAAASITTKVLSAIRKMVGIVSGIQHGITPWM
jgi:hypothetical protein